MLARRAGAELWACDKDCSALVLILIKNEFRIVAPCREETIFKAATSNALEVDSGNNLVGINIAAAKWNSGTSVLDEFLHDV
jgi:hypothetical protein